MNSYNQEKESVFGSIYVNNEKPFFLEMCNGKKILKQFDDKTTDKDDVIVEENLFTSMVMHDAEIEWEKMVRTVN